jgi:hypothetical protein
MLLPYEDAEVYTAISTSWQVRLYCKLAIQPSFWFHV